jgi:GDP-L-fucose synthase
VRGKKALSKLFDLTGKSVFVAGHRGMVGSALLRLLQTKMCTILTVNRDECDLTRQEKTEGWMCNHRPQVVIIAAARVGGILANATYPVDFLQDNLLIETNLIKAAYEAGCEKLLFLGSSCIYPRFATQPINEDQLLTGALETTNQWYAIAKIAGLLLCQAYRQQYGADFISAMPTNLYGPNDNFDLANSHVVPALIRKVHEAKFRQEKEVVIWGTGTPRREFLHVDDLADACLFLLENYSADGHVNVGVGEDVTIKELALIIKQVVGFAGDLVHDTSKPDGTPRKLLSVNRLNQLGWRAHITLNEGLRRTYEWWLKQDGVVARID